MKEEFDFLNYIDSKLLEIDDLNQRSYGKCVLKEVFGELLRYSQTAVNEIENRMLSELSKKQDYTIVSGVMSIEEYDETNRWMFPMCREDIEEKVIKLEQMKSALNGGEGYRLCTVMFDTSLEMIKELENEKKYFPCEIKSSEWSYKGKCYILPRTDYINQYINLYKAFQRNGIRYYLPNIPYLRRFFDVYLETAEFYDISDIAAVEVNFGEYKSYVRYHTFPVWNIEKKTFLSDVKPKPCENIKQFCHVINNKRLSKECSYLVAEEDLEIYGIHFEEDLQIITSENKKKKWELYAFSHGKEGIFKHEFYANAANGAECAIRSRADVFHFVKNLNYEDYMILKRIEILETGKKEKLTYDMNFYITDYFPVDRNRKQLCLYFENVKGEHPMLYDVLSYIITALQEECREYECIGVFI